MSSSPHPAIIPAIVIVACDRPASLARLLGSLAQAKYAGCSETELVISIDAGGNEQVPQLARSFHWEFGPKRVIARPHKLGLKDHVLVCADLTAEYGSIVMLEDDVMVSPLFYQYALKALAFYQNDPRISGISLYSFIYNEFAHVPFGAIDDGNDVYFVQSGVSWGQVWTAGQWTAFRQWLEANANTERFDAVPKAVREWPKTSWKKYFNAYMAAAGKYFVIPRNAMSTNMGDAGTHFAAPVTHYTVPLSLSRACFRFVPLKESKCRYDAFFEIEADCLKALVPSLSQRDLCVDLNGTKELQQMAAKYILTVRSATDPLQSFGLRHMPPELNIILGERGEFFHLARRENIRELLPEKIPALRSFFQGPLSQ
jgi:hypothetical protein